MLPRPALTRFGHSPERSTAPVRVGEDGHPGAEISTGERRAIDQAEMQNSVMQDGPEFRCWAHRQALLQDRERSLPVPRGHILRDNVRCRNHGRASKLADRADHEPQHDRGSDGIGRDGPARRQVSPELLPGVDACSLAPARLGLALSSLLQLPRRDPAPRCRVEGGDTRQRCDLLLARAWRLASCSKDPARLWNLRRRRSWVDGARVPNIRGAGGGIY